MWTVSMATCTRAMLHDVQEAVRKARSRQQKQAPKWVLPFLTAKDFEVEDAGEEYEGEKEGEEEDEEEELEEENVEADKEGEELPTK